MSKAVEQPYTAGTASLTGSVVLIVVGFYFHWYLGAAATVLFLFLVVRFFKKIITDLDAEEAATK